MNEPNYGVINEQGDLGLGYYALSENEEEILKNQEEKDDEE